SNPGSFAVAGSAAYFDNNGSQVTPSIKNNIFTEHPENVGFINYLGDNYDLKPGASAVNTGFNAGLNKVTFDLLNRPRPHNAGFDIGAFESQDPYAAVSEIPEDGTLNIFPVPSSKTLFIDVNLHQPTKAVIYVFDAVGRLIEKNNQLNFEMGRNQLDFDIGSYHPGIYILHLHTPTLDVRKSFTVN
ncbi:MAG: T9SS type A sorting domain-containing protein, partial [Bacteroidales bacterium]|nr:T9SS type A sorting domain-containing protein [Bacteroidales bacterium]